MSELDVAECWELVLAVLPGFGPRLMECRASSSGTPGLCNELGELADHVVELIKTGDTGRLAELFEVAERLLVSGTEYVKTAVATCFLENLQNVAGEELARAWVPYLGEASRAYCKAWDEFTGVHTPGLS